MVALLLGILATLFLTGCTSLNNPESSQVFNQHIVGVINQRNTIGQEILSNRSGVNGITLWLSVIREYEEANPGYLTLYFYDNINTPTPFYTTTISTSSIDQNSQVQVTFPSLLLSQDGAFYLELATSGVDIHVHGRLEDCYADGQAYSSRNPINADIAFQLSYSYGWAAFTQDIRRWLSLTKIIFPLLATFFIPGYALIRVFHLNRSFLFSKQIALSVGLSLAILPLVYLLASVTKITLSAKVIKFLLSLFLIIAVGMIAIDYYRGRTKSRRPWGISLSNLKDPDYRSNLTHLLILFGIFFFALGIRLAMVRDLATPAWVDSIHHGLITRLIVQTGSIPQNYHPFVEINSTLYHPGFHTSLAFFIQLSELEIYQGMLLFGQILNAMAILSTYLLASTMTNSKSSGLYAALITGMFTAMPAYYTSWGRYPQLAGLIILPVPIALMHSSNQDTGSRLKLGRIISAGISLAGIFIVHYRVTLFLACLILIYLITDLLYSPRTWKNSINKFAVNFIFPGSIAIILVLPWLIPMIRDIFIPMVAQVNNNDRAPVLFSDFSWSYLTPALGKQALALMGVGGIWAGIQKHRITMLIFGWVILLFFLANLSALKLPGGAFINNSSVTIMLFFPIAVISGFHIDQLYNTWKSVIPCLWHKYLTFAFILVGVSSAYIGGKQIISILNPTTILSRSADLDAIHWIDKNIPDDETILINAFAWGYGLFTGADGGAWIPALAGNPTMPPPVIYGLGTPEYIDETNLSTRKILDITDSTDELWAYLMKTNIEYIYIGARGGSLSPVTLTSDPHFEVIYHVKNTWVFHLLP